MAFPSAAVALPGRSLLTFLCLAAVGCGGSDQVAAARWRTVTDTIGDTIVVRTVGARDSAALLTLVPEVQIGQLDGPDEYTFGGVGTLEAAPQGGVYVWDDVVKALRLYDDGGTFVRQIGRRGGGPGEYQEANDLAVLPDARLVLWDPRNARINVYDSAGTAVDSWHVANGLFVGGRGLWVDTAGSVYMLGWNRPPGEGDDAPKDVLLRLDRAGRIVDTLRPPLPDVPDATLVASGEGIRSFQTVPYMPSAQWEFTREGDFVTGRGDRYALTVHRRGVPLLRIEREVPPVAVQPDEADDAREYVIGRLRRADPSWRWNGPSIPETKPFFTGITVDADGRLWVRRSEPGERIPEAELAELREEAARRPIRPPLPPPRAWREPVAYDVFAPDGEFLGHLPVPPRTSLLYMSGSTVWATVRDSLDVPTVTRFRVEPAAGLRDVGQGFAP
ncbi:MAG TPA: 6-bladed beta-propeller [Gemmatimonadaceae bacterium]|nr:6-bladed beta-propeller [Gemmatimonadaceae bacterium]